MIEKLFFTLFTPRNIYCGYLLESPRRGDSNKYPQHMLLGVLNTVFLNISNYLSHLELRNRSIQIVVVTNIVVISNVGIKRFDCIKLFSLLTQWNTKLILLINCKIPTNLVAHLSWKLRVSYCDRSLSVVVIVRSQFCKQHLLLNH